MTGNDYPLEALKKGEEGIVQVSFDVQPDGSLANIRIKKSSGSSILDQAGMAWVRKKCRAFPQGKVITGYYYTFNFNLTN
jgi:TonB family protein